MGRQRLAIFGLGIVLLAYLGFLVYAIGFEPQSGTDSTVVGLGTAKLVGDDAMKQLSSDWSEESLKRIVDPRMHEQVWFKDLADKLPIFKEDLGAVVKIESEVTPSKNESESKGKLFKFTATTYHTKGSSSAKLLIFWDSQKWGVLLMDVQVEKTNPKLDSETTGT